MAFCQQSLTTVPRSEEAAGDREGIGTVLLAVLRYLHTKKHLHGSGIMSAGPTCRSSPASVCRACSHACGIGDTWLSAQASRLPGRGGPKAGFRHGGTGVRGRAGRTGARSGGRAGSDGNGRRDHAGRRGRRFPRASVGRRPAPQLQVAGGQAVNSRDLWRFPGTVQRVGLSLLVPLAPATLCVSGAEAASPSQVR